MFKINIYLVLKSLNYDLNYTFSETVTLLIMKLYLNISQKYLQLLFVQERILIQMLFN
jgi:hypothetical protein